MELKVKCSAETTATHTGKSTVHQRVANVKVEGGREGSNVTTLRGRKEGRKEGGGYLSYERGLWHKLQGTTGLFSQWKM
jgi:hypothetical protein